DDVRAYLDHQVTIAGGALDKIFAADAIAAIHRYTRGVPRLVNNLCETALTLAATRGQQPISTDLVVQVATGLLGLDEPESSAQAAEAARRSAPSLPAQPAESIQATPQPQPAALQPAAPQPAAP